MGILRLLLALSVLTAHMKGKSILGFRLLYGDLAVECFFMISGFYMALVLNEKYNRPGDYFPFLWQRILRLFPAFLVVLFLTLVAEGLVSLAAGKPWGFFIPWFENASILSPTSWFSLIFSNIFIITKQFARYSAIDPSTGNLTFGGTIPHAIPAMDFSFVPQAWTLDLELCFYLLAPFLVRRAVWVQLLITAASIGLRLGVFWIFFPERSLRSSNSFFPYELAFFMLGSLAYQIYRHQLPLLQRMRGFTAWFQWIFFIIILYYSRLPGTADLRYCLFLPLLFVAIPLLFVHTRDNSHDRLIGELSYPFYLVHVLILSLMRMWVPTLPGIMQGPLYVAIILGTSYVLFRLVDQQIDAYRHRLFSKQRQEETATLAMVTSASLQSPK